LRDEIEVLFTENLRESKSLDKDGTAEVVNQNSESISIIYVQDKYDESQSCSARQISIPIQAWQHHEPTDSFQNVVSKFMCYAPAQQKARNFMISDTQSITQNLNPKQIFQHVKARRVQSKVFPDSETTSCSSDGPNIISPVDQQQPSEHVIVQQYDLIESLESVQTESWKILCEFRSKKKTSRRQVKQFLLVTTF